MSPKADLGMMLLAAAALGGGAETMRRYISEINRNDGIEAVHQMRVASRRLCAALRIFEPVLSQKPARRWHRAARRVTRVLGGARDADVQLEFVARFLKENSTDVRTRTGLDRLRLRLQQQRQLQQQTVLRGISRLENSGALDQIDRFANRVLAEGQLACVMPGGDVATRFGKDSIRRRLDKLSGYGSCVSQPTCVEQLHQMRIATKRLRYTLEVFVPVFGRPIKSYIKHTKKLQALLGDLHDLDVWVATLPVFIEKERHRTIEHLGHARGFGRLRLGLDVLLEHCSTTRQSIYEEFSSVWCELDAEGVWGELLQMCVSPLPRDMYVAPPAEESPERGDASMYTG